MGGQCESCKNVNDDANTLTIDPLASNFDLQPHEFYNDLSREIAKKLGPFKYDNEDVKNISFKEPVVLKEGLKYIGEFKNGLRHGRGKQCWPDYSLYEGYW